MTGAAPPGFFVQYHDTPAAGMQTNAVGMSFPVTASTGSLWLVSQTVTNQPLAHSGQSGRQRQRPAPDVGAAAMRTTHERSLAGFSLIELMVTIVIVAILASIAVPPYNSSVRKSRRTEAKTAILDLAAREERLFATQNVYSNDPAALGYGGRWQLARSTGRQYYQIESPDDSARRPATTPGTFTSAGGALRGKPAIAGFDLPSFQVDQTGKESQERGGLEYDRYPVLAVEQLILEPEAGGDVLIPMARRDEPGVLRQHAFDDRQFDAKGAAMSWQMPRSFACSRTRNPGG